MVDEVLAAMMRDVIYILRDAGPDPENPEQVVSRLFDVIDNPYSYTEDE